MPQAKIVETRPVLHVFGHIHAGHGVSTDDRTLFVNAAVCDDEYQPLQKPILIQMVHA